ncbi:MAG: thioredoxin family protein [Nocardioidaceae bacterium]
MDAVLGPSEEFAVNVELRFFDGCPNATLAHERMKSALRLASHESTTILLTEVMTAEQAQAIGFVDSPTVLVDGPDPFAVGDETVGLGCRLFRTPDGLAGSPALEQMREALL